MGITTANEEGEDTVDTSSEEEGTGISTVYEEGEDKAYASSEDTPSNSPFRMEKLMTSTNLLPEKMN